MLQYNAPLHMRHGSTVTYNTAPGDVLPFDIVTAKQLGIDCTASSFAPGGNFDDTRGFVEMIATPVCVVGPKNNSYPYDVAANPSFKTTAATPFALLTPNPQRIQFFVVNTSTDADLLLQFGNALGELFEFFILFHSRSNDLA